MTVTFKQSEILITQLFIRQIEIEEAEEETRGIFIRWKRKKTHLVGCRATF
jgi:hypothetical protein